MARCCGGSGGGTRIVQGRKISVSGTGTSQDPFVIASDVELSVQDSATFDIGLSGDGTLENPWLLRIGYADTARLTDIPDVDADSPSDTQVLGWSASEGKWIPFPPAIATPGLINHDTSLNGDGSVGSPLAVRADTTRYVSVTAAGVGLNNAGINSLVRLFPDAASRDVASPVPGVNTISMLATNPGQLDYFDGSDWLPLENGIRSDIKPGELLALSGSYAGGPVTNYVAQVSATTDPDGMFEVIPADDLTDYAGVLRASIEPVGPEPWGHSVDADGTRIIGYSYRLDDGTPNAGVLIDAVVSGLLY